MRLLLTGIVLILHGLLSIAAPEVMWFLTDGWKFKDAEPSDGAITFYRVFGVFSLLVGIYLVS